MLVCPSSTARKVARIGAKRPYAAPNKMLQAMPTGGHEIKTAAKHMQIRSFKAGPNCLVLHCKKI